MEALRSAYDSDSEPDANSKPLDSLDDAAIAQAEAGAGANEAQVPDDVLAMIRLSATAPAHATGAVLAPQHSMLLPQKLPPQSTPAAAAGLPAPEHEPAVHRHVQGDISSFDAALDELEAEDSDGDGCHAQAVCAGMHIWESASDDSDFEYGPVVRELRTGRYSKLEGKLFGSEQVGGLTLHTRFEAASGASAGYKTLERGMAVDAEGSPVDTWLVRIVGGTVAGSAKGKSQWKYVALLKSDEYDEASDTAYHNWYYSPLQKLTPLVPIETSGGKVACNADGSQKRSFNGSRHEADKALAVWVPQSINTLSRKAGELTPRVARADKKARAS